MSGTTIVVMILILGFVWGGLAFIMITAARKERGKTPVGGAGETVEP
jgi:hypothetical protein